MIPKLYLGLAMRLSILSIRKKKISSSEVSARQNFVTCSK